MKRATKALKMLGIEPVYLFSNGGLDANWLDKHGVPTITIGAGQAEIHTIKEYVNLSGVREGLPPRRAHGDAGRLAVREALDGRSRP